MDFLLDNPLATMEGPIFLILYAFFNFFTLLSLGLYRSQIDKTERLAPPAIPPSVDPFEVAYLRGGVNEMARAIIFSLVQKGLIEIESDGKGGMIKVSADARGRQGLADMEHTALRWLDTQRDVKEVFDKKRGLVTELEPSAETYQVRLESRQMLTSDEMRSPIRRVGWPLAALIAGLGIYKVLASIAYGNFNFMFTVIMAMIAVFIAMSITTLPRLTKLGKAYLERLQFAFNNLRYTPQATSITGSDPRTVAQTGSASVDPLLLSVGVFGTGVLAGTMYASYSGAFHRAQQASDSSSGGCSSGCGSCSSGGDGGGGDGGGGGGSCGGGCGGGGCGG